jgi:hypothetical protein
MWVTNLLKVLRKAIDLTLSTLIFRHHEKRGSSPVQPDEREAP